MEKAPLLVGALGLWPAPTMPAPPVFHLQAQPDWLARELPSSALRLLEQYPAVGMVLGIAKLLAKPLIFLAVLLLVGLLLGRLADRAILPGARDQTAQYEQDERTARRLAVGRLAAWLIALVVASEAAGLHWVLALLAPILHFVGMVLIGIAVLLVGAFIALTVGGQGRELLLSILGSFYLRRRANAPETGQAFDLGDGIRGKIEKVEFLHTTFVLPDGTREVRPNAWLMRTHFHWGGPVARPQPTADAWAAEDGPAPPPLISDHS